jgi:hypothetical protein
LALKPVKLDFPNNSYNSNNKEYPHIYKLNIHEDLSKKYSYLSEQQINHKQVLIKDRLKINYQIHNLTKRLRNPFNLLNKKIRLVWFFLNGWLDYSVRSNNPD